ncbi:MAG: hypothetical protein J3K34DRAFT_522386 [Monoraphidium minutum]|nr:MAG: hypothetical protein J3K34DRAFT_522386 [Monoraphidium minutum]
MAHVAVLAVRQAGALPSPSGALVARPPALMLHVDHPPLGSGAAALAPVAWAPWSSERPCAAQALGEGLVRAVRAERRRRRQRAFEQPLSLPGGGAAPAEGGARAPAAPSGRGRRAAVSCRAVAAALPAGLRVGRAAAAASAAAAGARFAPLGGAAAAGLLLAAAGRALRRWHAARRAAGRRQLAAAAAGGGAAARDITVVTFNIRGVMDRWGERAPLLRRCLEKLDADVVCFQEVLTGEFMQDSKLLGGGYKVYSCRAALDSLASSGPPGAALAAAARALLALPPARAALVAAPPAVERWRESNRLSAAWARVLRDLTLVPFFGNSIASRLPRPAGAPPPAALLLGGFRAAQRVCVAVEPSGGGGSDSGGSGSSDSGDGWSSSSSGGDSGGEGGGGEPLLVWLVNTHLDHADPGTRERQVQAIMEWMEPQRSGCAGVVITGDLNAAPGEPAHAALQRRGYSSASLAANGAEPAVTWPSGLVAPLMDTGEPHCADYVYVAESPGYALRVAAARVAGDAPAPGDATLYPSDHLALHVRLSVARRRGGGGSGATSMQALGARAGAEPRPRPKALAAA